MKSREIRCYMSKARGGFGSIKCECCSIPYQPSFIVCNRSKFYDTSSWRESPLQRNIKRCCSPRRNRLFIHCCCNKAKRSNIRKINSIIPFCKKPCIFVPRIQSHVHKFHGYRFTFAHWRGNRNKRCHQRCFVL